MVWRGGGLGPDTAGGGTARGAVGLPRSVWGGESSGCRGRCGEGSRTWLGEVSHQAAEIDVGRGAAPALERRR
jgi:hypothetical protein